jgi:hypothetical protein
MKVSGIIYQQICQLKWHLLACLGLIMVLPLEEAIVILKAGGGFFSDSMTFAAILFGPLLAGLIACANVQTDLDEKRYIFWRSKPVDIKWLISLKFFIGLIASLLIITCPLIFHIISNIIWNKEGLDKTFFKYYAPLPILISIMTYSLCFASNVLVRKTARAWLIGMLIACFLLVFPFMLPLDFKDFVSDVMIYSWGPYMGIILAVPAAAFIFALYAAKHDWHLRTNLKGLLWVGAWLAFVLMMLFSSQVANIKVLQEKEVNFYGYLGSRPWPKIVNFGGKLIFSHYYIDIYKNKINLSNITEDQYYRDLVHRIFNNPPNMEGYYVKIYPSDGMLYKNVGNDVYSFNIHAYCRSEKQGTTQKTFCDKVYLRCYKNDGKDLMPVCVLDISDCLTDKINVLRTTIRLIDNRLIACMNDSCVVVDATDPEDLKLIDKKLDVLKKYRPNTHKDRKEEFAIPLLPVEEIVLQERIKLSIDLNYRFDDYRNEIYDSSIVDIHDGKIAFFFVDYLDYDDIARYDVTRWDDEKIYCKYGNSRPFTILESVTGAPRFYDDNFVKNGKFYCRNDHTLMVFDVRSNRRIRKLGHFVRMDYDIEDMAALEDGNILLCVRRDPEDFGINRLNAGQYYLYLLKNPE